ncbi:MAG TPA: alpha-glucan family phosphorylase [Bryobacteraceae bacterium]|nr:alpha-glucan family phosphorylase [Bryobacteraceae bacterium]
MTDSSSLPNDRRVAYFSMEIALRPDLPTYAGGLGVLAGDMLRSAADLAVPMVGVTLVYRKGYFRQRLDDQGNQQEEPAVWKPEEALEPLTSVIWLELAGRRVQVRAWRFTLTGISGATVPVYLLDTDLPENDPADRGLTDYLYGGDPPYRLRQEAVLGMGGVKMLNSLGHTSIENYHLNEGHSALLTFALLEQRIGTSRLGTASEADIESVRQRCVFTTHTPVPAAFDKFPRELVDQVIGSDRAAALDVSACCQDGALNMTYLALRFSRYINGVAMHHGEVSRGLFPNYPVRAITNGVHAVTWSSPKFQELYDRHVPEWRKDNLYLRYVVGVTLEEIRQAHASTKLELLAEIKRASGADFDPAVLTIAFARRAAAYKRADLLFTDLERLKSIAAKAGQFQVIFGGKAHPQDNEGKEMIRRVFQAAHSLAGSLKVVYIPDYDMRWAQLMTSGADLWLNTPHRPFEASGTSGMKAALNGVPSLSILDGWWIEGCVEGATGWAIGKEEDLPEDHGAEAASLYDKLERVIVPLFYSHPDAFAEVMRSTISLNGSFFNTERMMDQYLSNAYSGCTNHSRG